MSEPPARISLWFLGSVFGAVLVTGIVVAMIGISRDHNAQDAAALVSAVLAPASGIVGLLVGHHVGSRRP